MSKNIIHMSEAEAAATDIAALLKRVDEGAEIVIERESRPPAILRSEHARPGRLLSESIALAEAHGSTVTLDGDFGRDLEEIVKSHSEPLDSPEWD
jgi:antitoxin (DNA-binding transcriptional repressor) of toxin-antitoxin stability system